MPKLIKDVFSDYTINNNLIEAEIQNINLYKKTNKLQVSVIASKPILLVDIESFENYAVRRFKVAKVAIDIEYQNVVIEQNIEKQWNQIVNYIAKKEPFSRAVLNGSRVEMEGQNLSVKLALKGSDFLLSKKFDKGLEHLLLNLYGKNYKVRFIEEVDENYREKFEEEQKKQEMEFVKQLQEEADRQSLERQAEESIKAQEKEMEAALKNQEPEEETPLIYGRSLNIKSDLTKIAEISVDSDKVCLDGEVVKIDSREIKNEKTILMIDLYDGTSTMTCKAFVKNEEFKKVEKRVKNAKGLKIDGVAKYDPFSKEIGVMINTIIETSGRNKQKRVDNATEKRVELHLHTKMSQMDAVTSCTDLLKRAKEWGWKSIAITDHGVVQAFPDAHHFIEAGNDLKIIYGVEAYFAKDKECAVFKAKGQPIDTEYCVLDLETTGISPITEKITEVGIIKMRGDQIIDEFECFVNPEKPIPPKVVEITHITDEMVRNAETIDKIIPKIIDFIGNSVLVAHNAKFDMGFLKHNFEKYGYDFHYTYIDTLPLARAMFPDFKKFKLGILAEKLGITVEVAHRALDDVKTLVGVFGKMLEIAKEKEVSTIDELDKMFEADFKSLMTYHMIILAKNYVGLKNLYKLISYSHLNYFYKKPRILKSVLDKHREGLIIGSACEAGELYRAVLEGKSEEEIEEIAEYYDYLEIQPIGNDEYLIRNESVSDKEALRNINRKIVEVRRKTEQTSCCYL